MDLDYCSEVVFYGIIFFDVVAVVCSMVYYFEYVTDNSISVVVYDIRTCD